MDNEDLIKASRDPKYNKKKASSRKKRRIRRVIFTFFFLFLFLIGLGGATLYLQLGKINYKDISKTNIDLGITKEVEKNLKEYDNSIINIALFGVDSRKLDEENTRSDSIMIASFDFKHKKIKLTSIMRDSYVEIAGHDHDKINHAYAYGGPQLAIKTINQNFNLNIRDYATVNFYGMEGVIDAVDGLDIDVKKNEVTTVNKYIKELCDIDKKEYTPILKSGIQQLNGRQAVAYARIRSVGNGDFERTERQRTVMNGVLTKVMNSGVGKYPSIVTKLLPLVETSMNRLDIIKIGTSFLTSGISNIEQARFPADNYWSDLNLKGVSYIKAKMPETKDQIHKFIFEEVTAN